MSEESAVDERFAKLQDALSRENEKDTRDAIWNLRPGSVDWREVGDRVVERLLELLSNPQMSQSSLSGHILMFFEFESARLNDRQKWLCIDFLNKHGDTFTDGFAGTMVASLRDGLHLRMKKPNPEQWAGYQKMKSEL